MTPATERDLLDTISAVATLITPFLLLVLGGIGWWIKRRVEASQAKQDAQLAQQQDQAYRIRELEDRLREDRISTYNALLEPFFILFTSEAAFSTDKKYKGQKKDDIAISRMVSVEYRQVGFKLSLVANDEVVRAYNKLMQFFYQLETDTRPMETHMVYWLELMGELLLQIRRSMGNAKSELDAWEMLEWFIKDTPLFVGHISRQARRREALPSVMRTIRGVLGLRITTFHPLQPATPCVLCSSPGPTA